jgi:hypothetical protein
MKNELCTIADLHERFICDPEKGVLIWREFTEATAPNKANRAKLNKNLAHHHAGYVTKDGYKCVSIFNKKPYVHRIIWAMANGSWPDGEIDHLNHDKIDNRIANLRVASRLENSKNKSINKNSTSGITGVSYMKAVNKWRAQISNLEGKRVNLGNYATKEQAAEAVKEARQKYNYHQNHGV